MLEEYVPWIGRKGSKLKAVFQHIYALLVVCIGFVFFRADTMSQGLFWIKEMFTGFTWNAAAMSFAVQQITPVFLVTLAGALIACCPVIKTVNNGTLLLHMYAVCLDWLSACSVLQAEPIIHLSISDFKGGQT